MYEQESQDISTFWCSNSYLAKAETSQRRTATIFDLLTHTLWVTRQRAQTMRRFNVIFRPRAVLRGATSVKLPDSLPCLCVSSSVSLVASLTPSADDHPACRLRLLRVRGWNPCEARVLGELAHWTKSATGGQASQQFQNGSNEGPALLSSALTRASDTLAPTTPTGVCPRPNRQRRWNPDTISVVQPEMGTKRAVIINIFFVRTNH